MIIYKILKKVNKFNELEILTRMLKVNKKQYFIYVIQVILKLDLRQTFLVKKIKLLSIK